MEDYIANEIAAYPTLTNAVLLEACQYLILLLVGSIALVTVVALLATLATLAWEVWQKAYATTPSPSTVQFNPTLRRFAMKKIVHTSLMLCCVLLATAGAAQAQTQDRAVTNGGVCRITEYRFKPGANNEQNFMKFLREHRVPIFTEQKRQGLIVDFKFFHNDTTRGPNETALVQSVCFRSYNDALDPGSNEERVKKLRDITVKHYGSTENMRKTIETNEDWVEIKRAYVLHEMTFNPPKPAASGN